MYFENTSRWGDPEPFRTMEDLEAALRDVCSINPVEYIFPEDGLVQGRDYEVRDAEFHCCLLGSRGYSASEVEEFSSDEMEPIVDVWGAIVELMDDSAREAAHCISPCSEQAFLAEYLRNAPCDLIY